MVDAPISHAVVLPDADFFAWLQALRPYMNAFERVAVIRSPGGNDLNPYRNITAVTAPRTWINDDPILHIRRIYPSVVRVDVVRATTPAQMAAVLQPRIDLDDRFGERFNVPPHIDDRFVLAWPTDHRPLRIVRGFTQTPTGTDADNVGLDILSAGDAAVLAGAAGTVVRAWSEGFDDALRLGRYVQVASFAAGRFYTVTYAGLRSVKAALNQSVAVGDPLGTADGGSFKIVVQHLGARQGYRLPNVADPTPMIYVDALRVQPTVTNLRVRTIPTTDGIILGTVNPWDYLTPRELHGRVLSKAGVQDQWIKLRMLDGRDGFSAAWLLQGAIFQREVTPGVNPVGVNLDAFYPQGTPAPSQLGNLGWVRLVYNVSRGVGSEDLEVAFNTLAPIAQQYAQAGYRVMFVITHQTYGEAQGFPPWSQLSQDDWNTLISRLTTIVGQIAAQFAGRGWVSCWQIWNEQDSPPESRAAVPVPVTVYAQMLERLVPLLRAADPTWEVITGGHISGVGGASGYASTAVNALSPAVRAQVGGVAFHPYGLSPDPGPPYGIFGHIDDGVQAYRTVLPAKPVWITEWGVLDRPTDSPTDIANYATNFISYVKARYPGQIATMLWYAWAQGQDNGYGIVDGNGQPRSPLTERFLQA